MCMKASFYLHNLLFPGDLKQSLCSRAHWKAEDSLFWKKFEKVIDTVWLVFFKQKEHCRQRFEFYHKKEKTK
jgi:hypothetical protein